MNVKLYIGSRNAANHKAQMKEQTKTFKRCYLQYRNKQDNKMIGTIRIHLVHDEQDLPLRNKS